MDQEKYYQQIKDFNIKHYTDEVPYYSTALLRPVEEAILKTLRAGAKILDLGCGSGRFSIGAAKLGFDLTGVDITPAAIEAAQKRARESNLHDVKFVVGDMTSLPFNNNEFDFVFCPRFVINAVATKQKRKESINEMTRVVKTNGLVFIESFNKLYAGTSITSPINNFTRDIWINIKMLWCKFFKIHYSGLLPGDITYKSNKVHGASDGFAHIPTVFEFKSTIPRNLIYEIKSIPEIRGSKKLTKVRYILHSLIKWAQNENSVKISRN
ncbi:MAG: methyltransferase domain-containing protein [Patescibacteria group bacterium]|nr:methyltransferase domain-containing protein [Patescibacteria group bacterium]